MKYVFFLELHCVLTGSAAVPLYYRHLETLQVCHGLSKQMRNFFRQFIRVPEPYYVAMSFTCHGLSLSGIYFFLLSMPLIFWMYNHIYIYIIMYV